MNAKKNMNKVLKSILIFFGVVVLIYLSAFVMGVYNKTVEAKKVNLYKEHVLTIKEGIKGEIYSGGYSVEEYSPRLGSYGKTFKNFFIDTNVLKSENAFGYGSKNKPGYKLVGAKNGFYIYTKYLAKKECLTLEKNKIISEKFNIDIKGECFKESSQYTFKIFVKIK